MKTRAKVLGHAVHPMVVAVPIGLGAGTLALDALSWLRSDDEAWPEASRALAGLTCATGLAAGAVGFVDWLAIPRGTRAKRIGVWHAASNLVTLGLFAASFAVRGAERDRRSSLGAALSTSGLALVGLGGWLGGELVQRLGISVDPGANPNAPSSLARREVRVRLQPKAHSRVDGSVSFAGAPARPEP